MLSMPDAEFCNSIGKLIFMNFSKLTKLDTHLLSQEEKIPTNSN